MPPRAHKRPPQRARPARRSFAKAVLRSSRLRLPFLAKYDVPLRLRWWFVLFTAVWAVLLAVLGFSNVTHGVPVNDKLQHFVAFCIFTGLFYFAWEVDEDARRIWFWRYAPLAITAVVCVFGGSVASEYIQGLLPYKEFQHGDIAANFLGSLVGTTVSFHLERYHRRRREIAALYRPVASDGIELPPSDDDDEDQPELPLFRQPNAAQHHPRRKGSIDAADSLRMANVWDEREELFAIDDDDDMQEHLHSSSRLR